MSLTPKYRPHGPPEHKPKKKFSHKKTGAKFTPKDLEEIEQIFISEAKKIWKNDEIIDKIDFDVQIGKPKGGLFSLSYASRPRARDDILFNVPQHMTLRISEKSFEMSREQFIDFLRHEALHIGYPRHDRNFRELADQHKIPMTVLSTKESGYKLQVKEGTRYKTISVEGSLEEAKYKARQMMKDGEKRRLRVIY